jgi:hypothetical protein
VPAKAIVACRAIFREMVERMLTQGAKPKKQGILKILKECILRLNDLDEIHGHFIETTIAEELSADIDEIVYASGLPGEENVADRWRAW